MITTETKTVCVCDVCRKECEPCNGGSVAFGHYRDINYELEFSFRVEVHTSGKTCICETCAKRLMGEWAARPVRKSPEGRKGE